MKKSLILVGMLAIGYANAQTGKVGVNTQNPKATLEVVPSATNSANTATTNEGIVAPKLSKTRIANIAEANLVEGTLVYATDATYTGNNTKVAKITEKGYYFYNGTEWVKAGANPEDQLWAQRRNETYLVPADEAGNVVRYTKDIGLQTMMRNSEATTGSFYGGSFNVENSNTANDLNGVRTNIRNTGAVQNIIRGFYSDVHAQTQKDGAYAASTLNNIFGSDSNIYVTPNTTLTGAAVGVEGNAILYENSTTKNAYGSIFNYTANQNANVENLYGVRINPTISTNANVTNHYGLYINAVNSNGVKGENFSIYTNSGIVSFWDRVGIGTRTPSQKLEVAGNIYANSGRFISEINSATGGELSLYNNTKVDGAVNRWAIFNMNNIGEFSYAPGLHFWAYAADGTNLSSQMVITDAGNLRVGFASRDTSANDLGNKLEVNGNIRATSLRGTGERIVIADADGVLKTGVSVSNFATANIYTANGTLSGHRTVDMNGNFLMFQNAQAGKSTVIRLDTQQDTYAYTRYMKGLSTRWDVGMTNGSESGDNVGSDFYFTAYKDDGTNLGRRLTILRQNGNVGIGTATPTAKLDVAGNMRVTTPGGQWLTVKTGTGGITSSTKLTNNYHSFLRQETASGNFASIGGINDNFGIYAITADQTANATTGQLVINTTTGNVAIGQTNPDANAKLVVNGDTKITGLAGTGNRNVMADASGKLVVGDSATPLRTVTANTTLAATDNGGYVYVNASGATTITIPSSLPAGFSCIIVQQGTGQVTIAGSGVTLQTARGTKTRARYSAVGIIKRTTTEATITGDAIN